MIDPPSQHHRSPLPSQQREGAGRSSGAGFGGTAGAGWPSWRKRRYERSDRTLRSGHSWHYYPGPSNYQKIMVVLVLWSFWSFCLFCIILRIFMVVCWSFCARFVLICGRFVGCADLRAFARKTGSITKTTRIFWSLEDPGWNKKLLEEQGRRY